MAIKHLAIDIGGTLIEPVSHDWDITLCLRELLTTRIPKYNIEIERLHDDFFAAKEMLKSQNTFVDCEDELDYFIKLYSVAINRKSKVLSKSEIESVAINRVYGENIYSIIDPFFCYINGIKSIRKGFFSNTYPSVISFLKAKGLSDGYVDNCLSYMEGMKKPSQAFFERLLGKTKLKACNILIVDDSIECVQLANELGFHTVLFNKKERDEKIEEIEGFLCI